MKYAERWSAFVRAVEIADEVLRTATTYSAEDKQLLLSCNLDARTEPLHVYRNLASLRYTEQDFFDTWNEDAGPDVERFWTRVGAEGLPFERKDMLVEILARGSVARLHASAIICRPPHPPLPRATASTRPGPRHVSRSADAPSRVPADARHPGPPTRQLGWHTIRGTCAVCRVASARVTGCRGSGPSCQAGTLARGMLFCKGNENEIDDH